MDSRSLLPICLLQIDQQHRNVRRADAGDSARLTDNSNSEEISAVTACGYDAYMAIYYALDKAQSTDGATLRDALAALDVPGLVTGDLKFDENGDAIKSYAIIKTATTEGFVFADSVAIE